MEKESRETHQAARAAEVECKNLNLADMEEELARILVATLGVDDFVDLNTLRVGAIHPPFHRQDLTTPSRPPLPIINPPMPVYDEQPAPRGLLSWEPTESEWRLFAQQHFLYLQDAFSVQLGLNPCEA